MKRYTAFLIAMVLSATVGFAKSRSDFQRLLTDPQAFNGKHVTLVGIADLYSYGFFLCERALTDEGPDLSRSVFVEGDPAHLLPDALNKHWLKVTGIVDTSAHGPKGNRPFVISLERFEALASPPLKDRHILGVFRNDTSVPLKLKISRPDGYMTTEVRPGLVTTDILDDKPSVVATGPSGALVAHHDFSSSPPKARYFDSVNRRYYYRIREGRIELVPPAEGRKWIVSDLSR